MEAEDVPARGYAIFPRRLLGLVVDGFIFTLLLIAGMLVFSVSDTRSAGLAFLLTMLAFLLLYEPLLVWRIGGTVGHYAVNLRVEREAGPAHLGLFAALIRTWVKVVLGFYSFFFMLLTRRHQALHDKITRSVVVIHDLGKARPEHWVRERSGAHGPTGVSIPRRVAVILGYAVLLFLALFVTLGMQVSSACLENDVCSSGEDLAILVAAFGLILGMGVVVVAGLSGRLPGGRARVGERRE